MLTHVMVIFRKIFLIDVLKCVTIDSSMPCRLSDFVYSDFGHRDFVVHVGYLRSGQVKSLWSKSHRTEF